MECGMKNKKIKPIYAHGAVKPLAINGQWILFGATSAHGEDYPVQFQMKNIPDLIEWLEYAHNKYGKKPAPNETKEE